MKDKPYIIDGKRVTKDEYLKYKFDRFLLTVPKGRAAEIAEHAKTKGFKSRSDYINSLIDKDMRND